MTIECFRPERDDNGVRGDDDIMRHEDIDHHHSTITTTTSILNQTSRAISLIYHRDTFTYGDINHTAR